MFVCSGTGYLYEKFVVSHGSDTADASTGHPTPPEGEQRGSQSSREEYGPGLIEFADDPEVRCLRSAGHVV